MKERPGQTSGLADNILCVLSGIFHKPPLDRSPVLGLKAAFPLTPRHPAPWPTRWHVSIQAAGTGGLTVVGPSPLPLARCPLGTLGGQMPLCCGYSVAQFTP